MEVRSAYAVEVRVIDPGREIEPKPWRVGGTTVSFEDLPEDYSEKAAMDYLGYASVPELLAERFHMDIGLIDVLNPGAQYLPGETIAVVIAGQNRAGVAVRIEADKALRQVRAYDGQGMLIAAYPATIGSEENPSPSGSYLVEVVAPMPDYLQS